MLVKFGTFRTVNSYPLYVIACPLWTKCRRLVNFLKSCNSHHGSIVRFLSGHAILHARGFSPLMRENAPSQLNAGPMDLTCDMVQCILDYVCTN